MTLFLIYFEWYGKVVCEVVWNLTLILPARPVAVPEPRLYHVSAVDKTAALDVEAMQRAVLDGPIGITTDGQGNVIVADRFNHQIRVIAPDRTVLYSTVIRG